MFEHNPSARYLMIVEYGPDGNYQVSMYNNATRRCEHQNIYSIAWVTRAFRPVNITRVVSRVSYSRDELINNTLKSFAGSKGAEFANMAG